MELDRKEFHFDLDVDSLKLTYSDHDSSSWNAAWSDIRELLEEHGFEKPQYSGYESADKMSYLEAYHVIDILSDKLPWFSSCVKAATFTEIGESYDVKEFLENGMQLSLPLRPDTRKELHFDLGTAALSENYGSIRPNAWRGAWTLIRNFMERNDSSTPSIQAMNQRRRYRLTRHWPSWENCNSDIHGSRIPFSPHRSPRSANATMPSPISRVPVASSFRFPLICLGLRSWISSVPKSVI